MIYHESMDVIQPKFCILWTQSVEQSSVCFAWQWYLTEHVWVAAENLIF